MKKIFINICEQSLWIKTPKTYLKSYQNLYQQHNIYTYVYYIWEEQSEEIYDFLKAIPCRDKSELEQRIQDVYKEVDVIYINTFTEWLIELTNTIKKNLWEEITNHHESFRDKSLQRKFLQSHNPELWIKYIQSNPAEVDIQETWKYLWYPYIVKPSSWIQSAWVSIIETEDELLKYLDEYDQFLTKFSARWFTNSDLVFEEFIDGVMYSIDYYVDQEGSITDSQPVHVWLWEDIEIDDFMNYVRSFRTETISESDPQDIKKLIEWCVDALGIKNTFIHHEFKLTSKWKLKTIEINGRVWWYRLEMIQESFNYNWLACIIWKKPSTNIQNNFSSFLVYPDKKCILKWFNEALFSEINSLTSIYFINKIESFIWKEIWLTSQWFTKVAIIKIKNSNTTHFEQDYDFLQSNFKDLLIVE